MLIRSQDKGKLLKFGDSTVIEIIEIDHADVRISCSTISETYDLGKYTSAEKAEKVLDMIQEAYADFEATKCISTGLLTIPYSNRFVCKEELNKAHTAIMECADMLKKAHIFQMPEDGEVNV